MQLFKEELNLAPPIIPEHEENQEFLPSITPCTPEKYWEVDTEGLIPLINILKAFSKSLSIMEVPENNSELLEKLGIPEDEQAIKDLKQEYVINASINVYLDERAHQDYTLIEYCGPSCKLIYDAIKRQVPESIKDIILFTNSNYTDFLNARTARTLEILLSNPNLLLDALKGEYLRELLSAIYVKYSVNHDTYTNEYLLGLCKTLSDFVLDSELSAFVHQTRMTSFYMSGLYINPKSYLYFQYSQLTRVYQRTNPVTNASVFFTALDRKPVIEVDNSQENPLEVDYRLFLKTSEQYFNFKDTFYLNPQNYASLDIYKQDSTDKMPEWIAGLTVTDSRKVTIPLIFGLSEFMRPVVLVPTTTKVCAYLQNLYDMPNKPNPLLSYGERTSFLVNPEVNGFTEKIYDTLKYSKTATRYVDEVDICTYLNKPEATDTPSIYNTWYRLHWTTTSIYNFMGVFNAIRFRNSKTPEHTVSGSDL